MRGKYNFAFSSLKHAHEFLRELVQSVRRETSTSVPLTLFTLFVCVFFTLGVDFVKNFKICLNMCMETIFDSVCVDL